MPKVQTPTAPLPKTTQTAAPVAPAKTEAPPKADATAAPKKPSDGFDAKAKDSASVKSPDKAPPAGLDGVKSGEVVLGKGAKGKTVKDAQHLLEASGYKLKHYGADGDFGKETEGTLKRFQKDNGLPESGKIDKETLVKLEAGAKQKAKFPEYDKMFSDGVMRSTIAVGYDEGGAHKGEIKKLVDGLGAQGYQQVDVSKISDAEIKKQLGVDPATVDKDGTYFVKKFEHGGKPVTAVTRLITPDTPNAKGKFADAVAHDEVVMYTGHGRYGSGPDFDDIKSKDGNFRIGDPYERGHVKLGENDLKKTQMTKDYQLMFFDGCNTRLYVDDLRGSKAEGKNTKNLDIVGANTELSWGTSAADVLAMNNGLTNGKSIDDIKKDLNAINYEGKHDKVKDKFLADGFKDNAVKSE